MMQFIVKNVKTHPNGFVEIGELEIDPNNIENELKAYEKFYDTVTKHNQTALEHVQEENSGILLSVLIEEYCSEKLREKAWLAKTEHENRAIFNLLIRILGDIHIGNIDHSHAREYKKTLQQLPPNINKSPLFKDKSIDEIIAIKPDQLMAIKTINKNLIRVSSLFSWATTHGYVENNYFSDLCLKDNGRASEERSIFTSNDLLNIYSSSQYQKHQYKHPYYYWLPLIALHSGMRIEEICQLYLSDIREVDDIWVFDINDNDDKKIKTKSSRRLIPIHSKLIELGLIDYVNSIKTKNHKRLFPELKKQRDGYSQSASKWFGRFKQKLGICDDTKVFHSFRHTFINQLKQQGFRIEEIEALAGHAGNSLSNDRYGKDYHPKILLKLIQSLDYSNELDSVKRYII